MTSQKTPQPTDSVRLVLRNDLGGHLTQSLRLDIRRSDLEFIEPVLQRLLRSEMNPGFSFRVEEVIQTD